VRPVSTIYHFLLIAALLSLLVTARAAYAEKPGEQVLSPEEKTESPIETVIDVVAAGKFYAPCFERFRKVGETRGISLSVKYLPRDTGFDGMRELLQRGHADLVIIPSGWLPALAESALLLPLDDLESTQDAGIDDIFLPLLDFYCRYDGSLYALPLDGDVRVYYYREDILEDPLEKSAFEREYGYALSVPKNVVQSYDFARFFTRKRGTVLAGKPLSHDFFGVGMALGPGWCHYEWLDRFLAYGGVYFDDSLRPLIAEERGVTALEDLKRLLQYAPPDTLSWGYSEVKDAFSGGRLASLVLWSDFFKLVHGAGNLSTEGVVGVSHVPGRTANGGFDFRAVMSKGGGVIAVATSTRKPDESFWVASSMSMSPGRSVYDPRTRCDPFRYSQTFGARALSETLFNITGLPVPESAAAEYLDAVRESMEHGAPVLTIPYSEDYIDLLDLYVHRALAGEMDPALALEIAAEGWDTISRERGYELQAKSWRSVYAVWERLYPFKKRLR